MPASRIAPMATASPRNGITTTSTSSTPWVSRSSARSTSTSAVGCTCCPTATTSSPTTEMHASARPSPPSPSGPPGHRTPLTTTSTTIATTASAATSQTACHRDVARRRPSTSMRFLSAGSTPNRLPRGYRRAHACTVVLDARPARLLRGAIASAIVTHFDTATAAVEAALAAGASYADARLMSRSAERMLARNGEIADTTRTSDVGIGVRALVGSSWGLFATSDLDGGARRAGEQAAEIAAASARVPMRAARMVPAEPVVASWSNPVVTDPADVSESDKADLLVAATSAMREHGADVATGTLTFWDTSKWFVSSEGHRIDQRIREAGGGIEATAAGDGETHRRSFPTSMGGQLGTRGWELVEELDLVGNAPRVAEEARALLTAPECPAGVTDVILDGSQVALQIHESVGHAIELDRILGWEAAYAGRSWLDLDRLGSLRYGSDLMSIAIDPTFPGALGSFGYDDEGTPAAKRMAVDAGTWVGVLAGRDSAALAGLDYAGSVRSNGWRRLPM